jgi:hypothetical protein
MEDSGPSKPKRLRRPTVGAIGQLQHPATSVDENTVDDVISWKRREQNVVVDVVKAEVDANVGIDDDVIDVGETSETEQAGVDSPEAAFQDSSQKQSGRFLLVGARQTDKETNPEPQESRVGRLRRPTSEQNSDSHEEKNA